jgi:hypothetical protein
MIFEYGTDGLVIEGNTASLSNSVIRLCHGVHLQCHLANPLLINYCSMTIVLKAWKQGIRLASLDLCFSETMMPVDILNQVGQSKTTIFSAIA